MKKILRFNDHPMRTGYLRGPDEEQQMMDEEEQQPSLRAQRRSTIPATAERRDAGGPQSHRPSARSSVLGGQNVNIVELLKEVWPDPDMDASDDLTETEYVIPMQRPPIGVHVNPQWVLLQTFNRILEFWDGIRTFPGEPFAVTDADFWRCAQMAERIIAKKGLDSKQDGDAVVAVLENCFADLSDKMWHLYLFPFGTWLVDLGSAGAAGSRNVPLDAAQRSVQEQMMMYMAHSQDGRYAYNPFSVTHGDILFLCHTTNYLNRLENLLAVFTWCLRHDFNPFLHRSSTTDADVGRGGMRHHGSSGLLLNERDGYQCTFTPNTVSDSFFTRMKYVWFFGSMLLHIEVMQRNRHTIPGEPQAWQNHISCLQREISEIAHRLQADLNEFRKILPHWTLASIPGSLQLINSCFRQAKRMGDGLCAFAP